MGAGLAGSARGPQGFWLELQRRSTDIRSTHPVGGVEAGHEVDWRAEEPQETQEVHPAFRQSWTLEH